MGSVGVEQFDLFSGYYNTINGKLTSTAKTRHGINPATEKPNPEVPVSTSEDVDAAVEAAQIAFKSWSRKPYDERRAAVVAFAEAVEKHAEQFAQLLTQEQGKPVRSVKEVESNILTQYSFNLRTWNCKPPLPG